jgi:hypothetical protein
MSCTLLWYKVFKPLSKPTWGHGMPTCLRSGARLLLVSDSSVEKGPILLAPCTTQYGNMTIELMWPTYGISVLPAPGTHGLVFGHQQKGNVLKKAQYWSWAQIWGPTLHQIMTIWRKSTFCQNTGPKVLLDLCKDLIEIKKVANYPV